jgi:hypothetical protein
MKNIAVFISVEDVHSLSDMYDFEHAWEYDNAQPNEFGRVEGIGIWFRFLAYQPERLNPEDLEYKRKLEICDSLNTTNK